MLANENRNERIISLDQLRGFALLTIFLVNLNQLGGIQRDTMFWTYKSFTLSDRIFEIVNIIFANSSRPLFAFMFGITMVIMYDRAIERQKNAYSILFRRMLILLLVGAMHHIWIWQGDILFMYAMDGLILLLFVSMSAWPLFLFGLLAICLYQPAPFFVYLDGQGGPIDLSQYFLLLPGRNPFISNVLNGLNLSFPYQFSQATQHLSFFLFGMAAYRAKLFHLKHGIITGVLGVILLITGIWTKYQLNTNIDFPFLNQTIFWHFSVSLGLVFLFLYLSNSTRFSRFTQPFEWVGKISLTHYLMQSIVFSSIFISASFSLLGKLAFVHPVPFVVLLPIGLAFFALQMWVGKLWLQHFYYGPFEWIWRAGTYWTIPPMRRHPVEVNRTVRETLS
ncbi:uncharacterized protein J2Z69_001620 [Paenibacillus shirakamiensis]|uniref:DUF418 domain-containing protein n=1 Tax=Paenibacillus shirakamiensis TaxID=1265935 RepID=A0ABS4JFU5_9BACL|nr:uncharacterized protein [Paenibacillus shirakamiensis]